MFPQSCYRTFRLLQSRHRNRVLLNPAIPNPSLHPTLTNNTRNGHEQQRVALPLPFRSVPSATSRRRHKKFRNVAKGEHTEWTKRLFFFSFLCYGRIDMYIHTGMKKIWARHAWRSYFG